MASKNSIARVGVIGPGGAGRGNTLAFAARDDVEIAAVADNSEHSIDALENALCEHVENYKENSFRRYVGEYEFIEMLDKEDLDIVGVFSPHSLHDIHSKYALRAGCHVIVEKPMANIVGDAITMTKIAMGRGLHLVVGYQRHYEDIYVTGKKVVSDGLIGKLEKFDVYLAQNWPGSGWRGDARFSGGGQPNDSGSHMQDIFLWMTGLLPKQVHGTTDKTSEDKEGNVTMQAVEVDAHADVTMEDGSSGKITILGNTQIGFKEWIILEGSEGILEIKDGIRFIPKDGEPQPLAFHRPEGYPRDKVDQIVGLAKGQYDTNYTSGINGIRTSWLTNSILETGMGPNEWNTVDCDALIEKEGYSRKFLHDLIEASAHRKMH